MNVRDDDVKSAIAELETPCVLVERPALLANLRRVRSIADRAGVSLRPHVKTHKSLALGHLQLTIGGAHGICASKPDEAIVFLRDGFRDVTIAYPLLDPRKLRRLVDQAERSDATLHFIADSAATVAALAEAAAAARDPLRVFMKVDVGLGRVGVDPAGDDATAVSRAIDAHPRLHFAGLLSHAGHAYAANGPAAIAAIAEDERQLLLGLRDRLHGDGITVPALSVGSTPTVLASERFDGLSEIRPGNYVYLDGTAVRLGIARMEDVALHVLATVVSRNDRYAIVDAGSKVLSSDKGAHGTGGDVYGRALPVAAHAAPLLVERLSEEHGWIAHRGHDLPVGSRVRIIPNHSCVVANLVGTAWLVDGEAVVERWTMQARGRVL